MDERLYEAAITGNVSSLSSLLSEDPNILYRVLVGEAAKETPLHIAAQFGHVGFVKEILKEKPKFARQLNSQERNPLHLASAEGHAQVVKALLEKDTQACFVRDRDGMIPLHLAAIKGRVEALKELVTAKKVTILIKTNGGEPLLHLCLKHDRFEAIKTLIEIAGDDREFMSFKDEEENTLLHQLAAKRQYKIIKLLFPYSLPHSYYTDERSREREMDERLYDAAITGNVSSLSLLLSEDPNILDRVLVGEAAKETPLHIAAQFGHVDFVKEILKEKPEFARQLNSQERNPLHLASAEGHAQVVKALLEKDKQACFVRDRDGMIPLHLAAIKGRVEAMKELVIAKKVTILVKTDGGEPLLHLCLKHDRFEAIKTLIEIAGDDREFMSLKDEDENTLLHLLAAKRQYKIIKFLFPHGENAKGLDVNAININGSTPLDVVREVPSRWNRTKIGMVFRGAKAKRARELPRKTRNQLQNRSLKASVDKSHEWTNKSRDTLMVVAILIATVTFQAMMTPPGGVWQQDECFNNTFYQGESHLTKVECNVSHEIFHKAGNAVIADEFSNQYVFFLLSNSTGFVHSILLILLLLRGFSFKRKLLMRYLRVILFISVISMFISYCIAYSTQNPNKTLTLKDRWVPLAIYILFLGFGLSTLLLFIAYLFKRLYRFLFWFLNKIEIVHFIWRTWFGVKKGLVSSLKFLWNKVVQNRMTSAPKEDPHHESVP